MRLKGGYEAALYGDEDSEEEGDEEEEADASGGYVCVCVCVCGCGCVCVCVCCAPGSTNIAGLCSRESKRRWIVLPGAQSGDV